MKINKKLLIITTIIILLPIVTGLVFWEQLPETMATHWGTDNEPNGWSSKAFTVFGIPGVMAALHIFAILMTFADPKKNNIGEKAIGIVYWIIPAVSLAVMSATYAYALGMDANIGMICCLLMGVEITQRAYIHICVRLELCFVVPCLAGITHDVTIRQIISCILAEYVVYILIIYKAIIVISSDTRTDGIFICLI